MSWDLRDKIISPIIVNLMTASILFLSVYLFKEPIYRVLKPEEPVELYPLYCVAEPYTDKEGRLVAELFIVNLTGDELTERQLRTFLMAASPKEEGVEERKPDIELKWREVLGRGRITEIVGDGGFNRGKGRIEISKPNQNNGAWGIRVREISPKAILRFFVGTDLRRAGVKRSAKFFVPFDINYPGE